MSFPTPPAILRSRDLRPEDQPTQREEARLRLYAWMQLARTGDNRILDLFRQGLIRGTVTGGQGNEALICPLALLADKSVDVVSFSHRGFGGHLIWSGEFGDHLCQYFANSGSPTKAREGNIHHGDPANRSLPMISHLGIMLSKYMERFAVQHAAGLVAVSPVYLEQLRRRYPVFRSVQPEHTAAIPFGADEHDLTVARQTVPPENNDRRPAELEIIYVGAGRSIMAKSFQRICRGLARVKRQEPELVAQIKIRLHGTYAYWKPGDPTELQTLAQAEGVGEMVEEKPARIGYVDATRLALAADGLLVLGVDDPAYMPSKLFLYALTGKPLLACMHARSQANDYFQRLPELGTLIHFDGPAEDRDAEDALLLDFLKQVVGQKTFARENIRAEFSAAAMTRKHAELFEKILASRKRK